MATRSHSLCASEFCLPGVQGAREKGGAEGAVGRFRRNHLVSVPVCESDDALHRLPTRPGARSCRGRPFDENGTFISEQGTFTSEREASPTNSQRRQRDRGLRQRIASSPTKTRSLPNPA